MQRSLEMDGKSHIHQSTIVALERAISAQSEKSPELMEKQRRLLEALMHCPAANPARPQSLQGDEHGEQRQTTAGQSGTEPPLR
jgi:hypothetical protein